MTTAIEPSVNLDGELTPTIDPKTLTLADWKLIAELQDYKIPWVYRTWIKAKGGEFLKRVGIDHWIMFATFLGFKAGWATERYLEFKNGSTTPQE
jgi:hypothetical protein